MITSQSKVKSTSKHIFEFKVSFRGEGNFLTTLQHPTFLNVFRRHIYFTYVPRLSTDYGGSCNDV